MKRQAKSVIFVIFLILILLPSVIAYKIEFYHSDNLGSPIVITDSSGDVTWSGDYESFGLPENEVGVGDLKYNSKELDDSGLYYYGARYYDSDVGRFITADSYTGELTDSQSQNKYIYVKNNPLKYVDPTGHKLKPGEGRNEWGFKTAMLMNKYFKKDLFAYEINKGFSVKDKLVGGSYEQKKIYNLFKFVIENPTLFEIGYIMDQKGLSGVYPKNKEQGIFENSIIISPDIPWYVGKDGKKISFSPAIALVHELTHAQALINGGVNAMYSEVESIKNENLARKLQGMDQRFFYWAIDETPDSTIKTINAGTPDDFEKYLKDHPDGEGVNKNMLKKYASSTFKVK